MTIQRIHANSTPHFKNKLALVGQNWPLLQYRVSFDSETRKIYHMCFRGEFKRRFFEYNFIGVLILKGVLGRDHVHMFLSAPPKLSLSNVMQHIKGFSSYRIQIEFPELRKR